MLKTLLGSSPKTTIIGFILGAVLACIPIFSKEGFNWKSDWPFVIGAIATFLQGRLSKDSNGITAEQSKQVHQDVQTLIDPTAK